MLHSLVFYSALTFVIAAADSAWADDLDTAVQHLQTGEYQKAYGLLQPLAESGNAAAQLNLGIMYLNGDGVKRDFDKSRAWLEQAADRGKVPAMVILSKMYRGGYGRPEDTAQVAKWLKLAAKANDVESMNQLGILHYSQKEYDQALVWFRKAADRDHPESQSFLGDLYRFGRAVKQDYSEAIRWYEKSATKNYPHALYMLAVLHGQGHGTPADRTKANVYYEKAAAVGHPEAKKYISTKKVEPEFGCVSQSEVTASSGERATALAAVLRGDKVAAEPALTKLAEQDPNDVVVQRCLGVALVGLSAGGTDAKKGEEYYKRARAAFQKAHELGDKSGISTLGLEWTEKPYSFSSQPVAVIMREGEAAFGRADYRSAARHYQRALIHDPNLYEAALYSGDAYYGLKDWAEAGRWYAKAISINPTRETAYRYWGNALWAEGKRIEARNKFVDALIAEPQNSYSHKGLRQWAQHYKVRLEAPRVHIPVKVEGKSVSVGEVGVTPYWIAYGMTRALPAKDGNALQQEVEALKAALQVARELGATIIEKDVSVVNLQRLEKKGLLEAFVLIHRPTKEIFSQYADYRKEHWDLLRRYWTEEVIKE